MENRILHTLQRFNTGITITIDILLLTCAALVLLDIILRQLGSSLGGTDEVAGYVMAIASSWGMAYTLMELGHVRIDLLRSRAGTKGRALFDLFAMLVLVGTITLVALRSWPVLARSLANGSRANTPLETPLALVQTPWFAGWVWFAVVAWLMFIAATSLILKGQFKSADDAIGTFGEADALR